MYRIASLLLVWSLVAASALGAQSSSLTGRVNDTAGTPLAAAQIVLLRGETISDYVLTDTEGRFALEQSPTSPDSLLLEVRYFGYATEKMAFTDFRDSMTIVLREAAIELREVIVREEELPITRRSDTLIYVTEAYADGTEDKVEDLLRKLPGVDVDENGNIEVGGEKVQRVLVSGQDAFGYNYKMATRNINAGFVEGVQVIENYSDEPLTADLKDEGELILNLDLGDRKRNLLFGELDAEAGNQAASQSNLNAFLIGPERTAVAFGQTNTLGRLPSSGGDLQVKTTGKANNGPERGGTALLRPPLANYPRNVGRDRYFNNEAYGGAGALLLQSSNQWRSRSLFSLDQERTWLKNSETINFLGDTAPLTRDDLRSFRNNRFRGWVESENFLRIGDKQRIDLNFRAGSEATDNLADIRSDVRGADNPDELLSDLTGDHTLFDGTLHYVRRLGPAAALRVIHAQSYGNRTQLANFRSDRYDDFSDGADAGLTQRATTSRHFANTYSELLYRKGKISLTTRGGIRQTKSTVATELKNFAGDTVSLAGLDLLFREGYLASDLSAPLGKAHLHLGGELALTSLNYARPGNTDERFQSVIGRASLGLERPVGKRGKLLWGGSLNYDPPPVNALVGGAYLADYQSLQTGLAVPYLQRTYTGYAKLQWHNLYRQFHFSAGADWSLTPNGLTDDILIDPLLIRRQLTAGGANQQLRFSGRMEKFLPPLRGSIRLRGRFLGLRNELDLGRQSGTNHYEILELSGGYQGKLSEWLKLSFGYTVNRVSSRISGANELPPTGGFLTQLMKTSVVLTPGKVLSFTATSDHFVWSGGGKSSAHLLAAKAEWKVNDQLRFSLRGINLLNQSKITQYVVTGFLTGRRTFDLRRRTLLVGISWKF